jgi:hypothetical protein
MFPGWISMIVCFWKRVPRIYFVFGSEELSGILACILLFFFCIMRGLERSCLEDQRKKTPPLKTTSLFPTGFSTAFRMSEKRNKYKWRSRTTGRK